MTSKTMIQSPHVASSQSMGVGGKSELRLPVQHLLWSMSCCGLSHLHTACAPLRCVMAKYLFTVGLHHPRVSFLLFVSFLQLCFSCSSPQNRFSSKIAIKSLWKFMSIVAAICGERRTTEHPIYISTPGGGFSGATTTNVRILTIKSKCT